MAAFVASMPSGGVFVSHTTGARSSIDTVAAASRSEIVDAPPVGQLVTLQPAGSPFCSVGRTTP